MNHYTGFDELDGWYTDAARPFVSTNGYRQSPPLACGVECRGCGTLAGGADTWIKPVVSPEADLLDWLEQTLWMNAHRISAEYQFEAAVKSKASGGCDMTLTFPGVGDAVVVPTKRVFQESDTTYVSWSLLYDFEQASVRFGLPPRPLTRGGFSASPAFLVLLFKWYDKTTNHHTVDLLEKKLVQAQLIADLFVKALYGYCADNDKYSVAADGSVGVAYSGVDKNFIQSFKKAWVDGVLMQRYTKLVGKGKTQVAAELWRVKTPPLFKLMRETRAQKRSAAQIMNPVVINEKTFRRVVCDMVEVVFKGVDVWDRIEFKYDEYETDRVRFNTALCLLQLGIGSRSRGIIAVNKITECDSPVKAAYDLMSSLDHKLALRVEHMTKDKPLEWKAYKTFKRVSEFDSDFTIADAFDVASKDSALNVVDRPLQYYLFDPVLHHASKGVRIDLDKIYASPDRNPRDVYMQLLKTCRDYLHDMHPDKVKWDKYSTGGRDIWVVAGCDRLSPRMGSLYRSVYPGMRAVCEQYLRRPGLGMVSFGTHELRRLYVCYSFEFFGRGKTKEIAYAQYVLKHATLSSTVFYTTLQFDMFLGSGSSEQIAARESMMASVSAVAESVASLKRTLASIDKNPTKKTCT